MGKATGQVILFAPITIGLPDLPAGFVFLLDEDGQYLIDENGDYLIAEE